MAENEREKAMAKAFDKDGVQFMDDGANVAWAGGFVSGYDAGAASAAAWVKIESEADLPKEWGYYLVRLISGEPMLRLLTSEMHKQWWLDHYKAWMPIPPYQPTEAKDESEG